MKNWTFIPIAILLFGLLSCDKEEARSEIQYRFNFVGSENLDIDEFAIGLQYVRVYEINEAQIGIRTIYIGGETFTYQKGNTQEDVLVFSFDNDLSKAIAFDFGFDSSYVIVNGVQYGYTLTDFESSNKIDIHTELASELNTKLTFDWI